MPVLSNVTIYINGQRLVLMTTFRPIQHNKSVPIA
jgi:hypothetical protein